MYIVFGRLPGICNKELVKVDRRVVFCVYMYMYNIVEMTFFETAVQYALHLGTWCVFFYLLCLVTRDAFRLRYPRLFLM